MDEAAFAEIEPLEGIAVSCRVISRHRLGEMETEIEVEGYDADEAVEIIRALTDGEAQAADP